MTGRHRGDGRPRTLLRTTVTAAVLVLVFASGTRLGVLVGSLDARERVVQAVSQCTEREDS